MDAIRSWGMSVCLAALAAGIAGVLAPKGNLEKIYRFAIALFFLCSVLVPLFNLRHINLPVFSVSSADAQTEALSDTVADQQMQQVKANLADIARSICLKQNVTPVSVDVAVTKDKDGSYDPQSVSITLPSAGADKRQAVVSAIKDAMGLPVNIRVQ